MTPSPPETPLTPEPASPRYAELIAREAAHWGMVEHDPDNPQLWDDPVLDRLVLARPYRRLVERAVAAGGPALELGCGWGDLTLELAGRGVDVTGLDLSPPRIEGARTRARAAGIGAAARFEVADLNVASLPTEAYQCVVAHDALHHVMAVEPLLDRVHASLRPGGTLLVRDFRGTSRLEKLLTAGLVAVLPTRQSYATKWRLRGRLRALLASEREKREALDRGADSGLHDASPFESISQASIERAIRERFEVVEAFTFCPYWYHAVPKLRIPLRLRHAMIRASARWDAPLHRRGWTHGSYFYIEARRA